MQQLEVTMNMDYQMKDTLIPKGAKLQGDKAYDLLYGIVQEDRRLFENVDDPNYRKHFGKKRLIETSKKMQ